jgi:hypothetical protein
MCCDRRERFPGGGAFTLPYATVVVTAKRTGTG